MSYQSTPAWWPRSCELVCGGCGCGGGGAGGCAGVRDARVSCVARGFVLLYCIVLYRACVAQCKEGAAGGYSIGLSHFFVPPLFNWRQSTFRAFARRVPT